MTIKEGERERRSKHRYTGETPSAFFRQRETFDENAHNLHKALSNREKKKKVDISSKIFLSW
jgi:hypothetical protein